MNTVKMSISVRPLFRDFVVQEAKRRQMGISRCIEELIMFPSYRDDYVYSMKEIEKETEQAEEDLSKGKLPVFSDSREMFKSLNL